jgi:S-adenosylmethionine:tRNA ribosyltransferase-isomerase
VNAGTGTGLRFTSSEATAPPEARGLTRDAVRLLVASRAADELVDSTFAALPSFLEAGDLLVINTSATIAAAVDGLDLERRRPVVVHLSTQVAEQVWVIEVRRADASGSRPWDPDRDGDAPRRIAVGEGAEVQLIEPYRGSVRLWLARLVLDQPALAWLAAHGRPIRYRYVSEAWPLDAYQTVYALEPGSAEMPSAGRPFTAELVTGLVARGVGISPVVLHTGVSSLEVGEAPYPERVTVPAATARRVDATRREGGRVIAVGTTVVRALESAVHPDTGTVRPLDGWTDLVVTPERGVRAVDGLLTGWHEPEASHLLMLEAIAGRDLLERSYAASLEWGYLWHEFGDSHLVVP